MDTRSVGAVLLKVGGLVFIAFGVAHIPAFFSPLSLGANWSVGESLGAAAITVGPIIVVGVLFWFFPGAILNRIVSGPRTEPPHASDLRPIEIVALTLLGAYLVAHALIDVAQVVTFVVATQLQSSDHSFISSSVISRVAAITVEFLIGVALCLRAEGVLNVLTRMRG